MITTEHMGLVLWDQEKDDFEHSKLADNFVKIDQHNHVGEVFHGEYEDGDHPAAPVSEPTPKKEILNYAEENTGVAKWEAVGLGEAIRTPQTASPTITGIKPESIWRYLLARRSVGHNQLDVDGVWTENLKDQSVTGKKLEKGLLPLGITVAWYKSPNEPSPGSKWRICNGEPFGVNDMGISEAANVPDLREKFIRGTEKGSENTTGGQSTLALAHTHHLAAHSHTVNNHTHGPGTLAFAFTTANSGEHSHEFGGGGQFGHIWTRRNAFIADPMQVSGEDVEGGTVKHTNDKQSLFMATQADSTEEYGNTAEVGGIVPPLRMDMKNAGLHFHIGSTDPGVGATGGATPGTNAVEQNTESALTTYNTEPPWYGLCYIIKVRT